MTLFPAILTFCDFVFKDPTAEDTMVVQVILASRMGTRELESDEEDENAFEVPRDQLSKFTGKAPPTKSQLQEAIEKASAEASAAAAETKTEDTKETKKEENNDQESKKTETEEPAEKAQEETKKKDDEKTDEETKEPSSEDVKPSETNEVKKEEDKPVVENKSEAPSSSKPSSEKKEPKALKKNARMIEVEEYLVKFKNFSYLHCQWLTEEELHRGDKRISQKVKRYKQKRDKSANVLEFCDEEPFNPDYVEVDRVLDSSTHTDEVTNVMTKHYLVKWRSLPYEDCTWELESDVDPLKIKEYEKWKNPPSEDTIYKKRPKKHEWRKWDVSPAYKNGNTLRPYQLEGVNWLLFSWYNGRNCLLADEMGLGKTIQSLTFLDGIFQYGIRGPFLVIAPLSTIPNWQREFELW